MQMITRSRRGLYKAREELWSSCRLCPMIQGCARQPTLFYCSEILREQHETRGNSCLCVRAPKYTHTHTCPTPIRGGTGECQHMSWLRSQLPPASASTSPIPSGKTSSAAADGYRCRSAGCFLDPPSGIIQIPSAGFVSFGLRWCRSSRLNKCLFAKVLNKDGISNRDFSGWGMELGPCSGDEEPNPLGMEDRVRMR